MTVAAITITYNRIDLTKQTVESFYSKAKIDRHIFMDNGSTDGTIDYLKSINAEYYELGVNTGIAFAFREGFKKLSGYDFILKLDNDIETVTDDIIELMLQFYRLNGDKFVCSPVDLNLDPAFAPRVRNKTTLNGYNITSVSHTGGAFQLIPYRACEKLCREYRHLKAGDYMIGKYFRRNAYIPTYLLDLEMKHIGIDQSTPLKDYVL